MLIGATTPSGAQAAKAAEKTSADVNYDSFLKLLIASMKNQDPTKPNDPAEMLSQLASFSNVEQSIKLNGKLDTLIAVSNTGQAAVLIGKKIETLDGKISGIVKSVEMGGEGLIAVLQNGKRIHIADGFRIN